MPQSFEVVSCVGCNIFQVQQVKKSNKWNCKLCGLKQSRTKVFGTGTGRECREHVQKLNRLVGESKEATDAVWCDIRTQTEETKPECALQNISNSNDTAMPPPGESRWKRFAEVTEDSESDEDVTSHHAQTNRQMHSDLPGASRGNRGQARKSRPKRGSTSSTAPYPTTQRSHDRPTHNPTPYPPSYVKTNPFLPSFPHTKTNNVHYIKSLDTTKATRSMATANLKDISKTGDTTLKTVQNLKTDSRLDKQNTPNYGKPTQSATSVSNFSTTENSHKERKTSAVTRNVVSSRWDQFMDEGESGEEDTEDNNVTDVCSMQTTGGIFSLKEDGNFDLDLDL